MFKLPKNHVRAQKAAGARAASTAALLNRPLQRAFDRRGRSVDIVTVKTKPGLKPQAVARAESDR
jgi:hypothetical protein